MIKIYKFKHTTEEWKDLINRSLKGEKRKKAINDFIKKNGTIVSIQEYFQDMGRNDWGKDYRYECFGEPSNSIEKLVCSETCCGCDDELNYLSIRYKFPEDLVESRTDWGSMKSYADGLANFIEILKDEIASGRIIAKN